MNHTDHHDQGTRPRDPLIIPSITIHIKHEDGRAIAYATGHPDLRRAISLIAPSLAITNAIRQALTDVAPNTLSVTQVIHPTHAQPTTDVLWTEPSV